MVSVRVRLPMQSSPNQIKMNAQKLLDTLLEMRSEGIDLSNVTINYRTNLDSDVEVVTYIGEDLFDAENNSVLTSIVLMADASDY